MYIYIYIFSSICLLLTAKIRLFAANGNGKRKFVFLGRQMINGNRRLLFQQTCQSMRSVNHLLHRN